MTVKTNWQRRRASPVDVPGMPCTSFILTLRGGAASFLPSIKGGGSTGCTAGRLILIPSFHSTRSPKTQIPETKITSQPSTTAHGIASTLLKNTILNRDSMRFVDCLTNFWILGFFKEEIVYRFLPKDWGKLVAIGGHQCLEGNVFLKSITLCLNIVYWFIYIAHHNLFSCCFNNLFWKEKKVAIYMLFAVEPSSFYGKEYFLLNNNLFIKN